MAAHLAPQVKLSSQTEWRRSPRQELYNSRRWRRRTFRISTFSENIMELMLCALMIAGRFMLVHTTTQEKDDPTSKRIVQVEHLGVYPAPYLKLSPVSPQITARGDEADEGVQPVGNSESLHVAVGNEHQHRRNKDKLHRKNALLSLHTGNPLKDQPNLSDGRKRSMVLADDFDAEDNIDDEVIEGSQQAFSLTKADYLKEEMCKTRAFKQTIDVPGCESVVLTNHFCYGQCNSFFIPRWVGKGDGQIDAFSSVAHCRPHRGRWVTIRLRCPGQRPRRPRKKVYVVKSCKCMAQEMPLS